MQGPLFTVQRKVWVPTARLVIVVVALEGVVITAPAGPLMMLHAPVAGADAALAAMVADANPVAPTVQSSWSGPASAAGVLGSKRVMVTCELVMPLAQGPLLKVHWKTLLPKESPLTEEVGLFALANVPVPLITLQVPVAGANGALPASVVLLLHTCWLGPAFALGLAGLKTTTFTSSCVVGGKQGPLLMVHRNVFNPMLSPFTWVDGLLAFTKVPVPFATVHAPVAGNMTPLPASVVLVVGAHNCWSGPAFAADCTLLKTKTVTLLLVGVPQGPLLMVQRKTLAPTLRPFT